ncbi:MAG: putative lipid II flippase FtsW [Candidatus Eisenbacteria bacterium]|uniref:Probable peptidoglycan glycosyltransferase FtsW n=1 Tax=Eiseniibacteriota bacterium TaxID=2212470 RepID=A0A849SM16_UNCEI|nr:putative lipid II flippase FtsW [Candidatus Eisenbacteria bacterium]
MNRGDRWLLILPLLLTAVGVIMVYSSSAILGITRYHDPDYFLQRQLMRAGLGVVVLLVFAKLRLRAIERAAPVFFVLAGLGLAVVVVAGHMSNGATRWLKLGFLTLQPTDLARLAAVVMLAWWLRRNPPDEHGFWRGVAAPLGLAGVLAGLILLQPNLSSAALLGLTAMGMLVLAGARGRHLAIPVGVGAAAAACMLLTHPYQMKRVTTFANFLLRGELDARGAGWQLDQSLIALGSGGWLGRGLGNGLQKYLFLPEAHTDFIFSILGEELGFVGTTFMIAALAIYLWRGMRATARAHDTFAGLIAGGLTLQIGLYALVNLSVATGLAPTTGLPLPFVSYGGSALLANLAAAGVLYRVSAGGEEREALARQRWAREGT